MTGIVNGLFAAIPTLVADGVKDDAGTIRTLTFGGTASPPELTGVGLCFIVLGISGLTWTNNVQQRLFYFSNPTSEVDAEEKVAVIGGSGFTDVRLPGWTPIT
jgi:hypothetical protein